MAALLHYGTLLASTIIAAGLVLVLGAKSSGLGVATAGIAFVILLPIARVGTMLIVFLHDRDYRIGAIVALVMTIICLGFVLGAN